MSHHSAVFLIPVLSMSYCLLLVTDNRLHLIWWGKWPPRIGQHFVAITFSRSACGGVGTLGD
jgi:hypothetical protein